MTYRLQVKVLHARNLKDADSLACRSDPFAVVEVGDAKFQTHVIWNSHNPVWNRMFEVECAVGDPIKFEVWDKDQGGIFNADDALGMAVIESGTFHPRGYMGELPLEGGLEDSTLAVAIVCCTDDPTYNIDGGGWRLVRRVAPADRLHPAKDHLLGSEEYGDFALDPACEATFSRRFDEEDFDEFLFATGDGSKWMIASRGQVEGTYNHEPREVVAFSGKCGSFRAAWQNLADTDSGPWIAPEDCSCARTDGSFLYGTPLGEDVCGKLEVTIVKASHLQDQDWLGKSDPFVIVTHGGTTCQTEVAYNTLDPVWNKTFEMDFVQDEPIALQVWDEDQGGVFNPDDMLGQASLQSGQFCPDGFSGELPLTDSGQSTITVQVRCGVDIARCARWASECNGLNVFIRKRHGWPTKGVPVEVAKGEATNKVQALESAPAQVWLGVGEPGFVFPELREDDDGVPALQAKPSFAICLSGGGFRATTCALGWTRAFHSLGILSKSRYLCSNSGGSWFNTCFSYQDVVPVETFLGTYCPPEELTPDVEHDDGSYGKVVADATMLGKLISDLVKGAASGDAFRDLDRVKLRAWSDAVGDAFLARHGLNEADCGYAMPGMPALRAESAGLRKVHQACRHHSMPYPIIVGTIMPPGDERLYHSYEFTPQYSGVPAKIDGVLGGVLVEPLAGSSDPPGEGLAPDEQSLFQRLTAPLSCRWVPPLIQMAGISSSFIAQNYANSQSEWTWEMMGCPEMYYWDGMSFEGREIGFADGGGTDNMAILPPLRRGVKKLLICCSIGSAPTPDFAAVNYDISGYFGATPEGTEISTGSGNISVNVWNRHVQVFPLEKCGELVEKLMEAQEAGEPLRVRLKMDVLENVNQGVAGGYEVDTLWLFNGGATKWSESLPEETKALVTEGMEGFPYFSVMKLNYTPAEVSCLSQLASWNAHQVHSDIKSLLLTA